MTSRASIDTEFVATATEKLMAAAKRCAYLAWLEKKLPEPRRRFLLSSFARRPCSGRYGTSDSEDGQVPVNILD